MEIPCSEVLETMQANGKKFTADQPGASHCGRLYVKTGDGVYCAHCMFGIVNLIEPIDHNGTISATSIADLTTINDIEFLI